MGAFFDEIPASLRDWVLTQHIFWVASAPLSGAGHVNVSPRCHDALTIVDARTCYYIDMTGSGNETISHLSEAGNGRMTLLWNAFDGPPRIVRFYGRGRVIERGSDEFERLLPEGDERILPGTRAVIWMDVDKVGTSCGYSVAKFEYVGERMTLMEWGREREDDDVEGRKTGLSHYWANKNYESVDGLPGLRAAQVNVEKGLATVDEKQRATMRIQRLPASAQGSRKRVVSRDMLLGVAIGVTGLLILQILGRWGGGAGGGEAVHHQGTVTLNRLLSDW